MQTFKMLTISLKMCILKKFAGDLMILKKRNDSQAKTNVQIRLFCDLMT